jgi:uncharacterized coiled-coil DUF342 family protein
MNAIKKVLALVLVLALVSVPVYAAANLQEIQDWAKLRNYSPSPDVSKLAADDTMTDYGRHMFYINHPELIADKSQFRQSCPQSEQTIVLGCYHSVQSGIAIFDVTDSRLAGVEQVTSAHEMLHAAYDRLSPKEKNIINSELTDYYDNNLTDSRIKDTINNYKKTEPNDVINEMHSIFGTEIVNLPAPLENYYKKYFNNRQAITNFSDQYESIFTQNQAKLNDLKQQIDQLKSQLNDQKQSIQDQEAALQNENRRMQSLLSSGRTEEYNSSVSVYNSRVFSLRKLIAQYNATVEQVNASVDQYNSLAYAQESLYDSLDTRLQTQTAQ